MAQVVAADALCGHANGGAGECGSPDATTVHIAWRSVVQMSTRLHRWREPDTSEIEDLPTGDFAATGGYVFDGAIPRSATSGLGAPEDEQANRMIFEEHLVGFDATAGIDGPMQVVMLDHCLLHLVDGVTVGQVECDHVGYFCTCGGVLTVRVAMAMRRAMRMPSAHQT